MRFEYLNIGDTFTNRYGTWRKTLGYYRKGDRYMGRAECLEHHNIPSMVGKVAVFQARSKVQPTKP